ncbi:MAG: dihydrofolate reductase family protein [Candidatus Methanoperedens sp.]|nr:dihydrofolate reductase family protein [Candidatus Methanoperedens sp.]
MRKVIVSEMVSLDGFFAGMNGEIDWHIVDEEFNQYAIDLLNTVDTILFGRVTYQLFEGYWPAAALNPSTSKSDIEIAHKINNNTKIVFSNTLENVRWKNTMLVKEVIPEEIAKMKQHPGKDLVIYGSGSIVSTFAQLGLIDEYRIIVNPVVLGSGKPLFKGIKDRINLKLLKTKMFSSGNVLLVYKPAKN